MSGPKRGSGVSEAGHQAAIKARLDRLAREAEAEAEVDRLYSEAVARKLDTTPQAIRQALVERKTHEDTEARASEVDAAREAVRLRHPGPAARARGRSRWTDLLFAKRWAAACERAGEPFTYRHVAPEFEWLDGARRLEADPDYLGRLWRKHGHPEPTP